MLLCQLGARFTISISSPIIFKTVFYVTLSHSFPLFLKSFTHNLTANAFIALILNKQRHLIYLLLTKLNVRYRVRLIELSIFTACVL